MKKEYKADPNSLLIDNTEITVIERYAVLYLNGEDWAVRPSNAREAFVIDWEDAGIVIPWPEGKSAKEAILEWARKKDKQC